MFDLFGSGRSRARRPRGSHKSQSEVMPLSVNDRKIELVRRPYKKSLSLTLKLNGQIRVSAPVGVSISRISDFVDSQEAWIEEHLKKYQELREAQPLRRLIQGAKLPLLGCELELVFERGQHATKTQFRVQEGRLIGAIGRHAWESFDLTIEHPELRDELATFYEQQARRLLTERIAEFSSRMELFPSGLSFRAQRTRWGSCSSRGRISLNWKLIIAPLEVIDYVVVHELSHLRHYDHSPEFWTLVGTQIRGYRQKRDWLRHHQYDGDFLSEKSDLHGALES